MKTFLSILFAGVVACSTFGQGVGPAGGGGLSAVVVTNGLATVGKLSGSISGNTLSLNCAFPAFSGAVDTRPCWVYDLKGAPVVANVGYLFFTNSGPCTITNIQIGGYQSGGNYENGWQLTFVIDGVTQTCQYLSFYSGHGAPLDNINNAALMFECQAPKEGGAVSGNGGMRTCYINAYTNAAFYLTSPLGSSLWTDTFYRNGPPVQTNHSYWFCSEVQATVAPFATVSVASVPGVGQVESVFRWACYTNGQGSLESKPVVYCDSVAPGQSVLANGTENFFGGNWYWNQGTDDYDNTHWGTRNETALYWLQNGGSIFTDGDCSYRFFPEGLFFNTNCVFNSTNLTGTYMSNDYVLTGWVTTNTPP